MEPPDRRIDRPSPGERGSWSHAPVARVSAASAASAGAAAPATAAPSRGSDAPGPGHPVGPGIGRSTPPIRTGFGLPSLRRNVCPHFYMSGVRGAIPIQAPHLLKALLRQPSTVSRCQLRGGVHLDEGFVNDVCLTPRFNQCVFYEDELTKG
jgi:hypothetical protein